MIDTVKVQSDERIHNTAIGMQWDMIMTQQRDVKMRQQCLNDAATFRSPLCVDQTPETVTQCGNSELQYSLSLP